MKGAMTRMHAGPIRAVVAGGGTGGHLFPGIALAEALRARDPRSRILFLCADRPLDSKIITGAGFSCLSVKAEGFKARRRARQFIALGKCLLGLVDALGILRRFKPHVVLGVGGYASFPTVLASALLGVPIGLHEQNLIPGMANRLLARFAARVYVSFPETKAMVASKKVLVTGNPLRGSLLEGGHGSDLGLPLDAKGRFIVLVMGGSQGARRINEAVVEALGLFRDPGRLAFIHQTGDKDAAQVAKAYAAHGIPAAVRPFFQDMGACYRSADLVLCRAGATTVAEVTALGKAACFIPFPFAVNGHQEKNAKLLVDLGAADMILEKDLTGAGLAGCIEFYADNLPQVLRLQHKARSLGRPSAAQTIVQDTYALLGWRRRGTG